MAALHAGNRGRGGLRPEHVYAGLRRQALELDARTLGVAASPELPRVFGGLMELGMDGGAASLLVVADGTTSLYYSTGGGVLGAGQHDAVRRVSRAFLAALDRHLDQLGPDTRADLPASGMIHLRALTFGGGRLVAAGVHDDFVRKRHPVWEAFFAGHAVIGAIRQLPQVR